MNKRLLLIIISMILAVIALVGCTGHTDIQPVEDGRRFQIIYRQDNIGRIILDTETGQKYLVYETIYDVEIIQLDK